MNSFTADLVLPLQADCGEGPVWDARTQHLISIDIIPGRIHVFDPSTRALRTLEAGAMVGCVAPRASGQFVAALTTGLAAVDLDSGRVATLHTPVEHDATRVRFNDGKCDPQGRLWAGTMSLHKEPRAGALYCFPDAMSSGQMVTGVSVSNGLAWNQAGDTFYYIDSPLGRVDAFDFDGATGRITARRTVIDIAGPGLPDGCTLDDEGMLWIAHWDGGCVTRWDPRTGRQIARIDVPAPQVTSCTFGDADRGTLYITSARNGLDAAQLAAFPDSGGLFACRPGVTGPVPVAFRG